MYNLTFYLYLDSMHDASASARVLALVFIDIDLSMLISQHPCSKVVSARVRKCRQAKGKQQAKQTKSNREN
jgi:hypothetical protein